MPNPSPSLDPRARHWLLLAIACLVFGGVLSLFLVAGRVPGVNRIFHDPLFARHNLVVHVTLTLGCWFTSFTLALFRLLPGAGSGPGRLAAAVAGIIIFCLGGYFAGGAPVLANYVPVTHNPVFLSGLALFFLAGAAAFLSPRRFLPGGALLGDEGAAVGLRVAALAYLAGLLAFGVSWLTTEFSENLFGYYEILFWGYGHILQLMNVSALLACWLLLYRRISGQGLLSPFLARGIFGFLLLGVLVSLGLLFQGSGGPYYYPGLVMVMRWGTWPSAAVVILLLLRKHSRWSGAFGRLELRGLLGSVLLLLLGFLLGSQISQATTLVPAHYHATIGAVTVAFMSLSFVLLETLGIGRVPWDNPWLRAQPLLYAGGQFLFSAGFAYAGLHGLGRKIYGGEQTGLGREQLLGLCVMGLGGALALLGGALFAVYVVRSLRAGTQR